MTFKKKRKMVPASHPIEVVRSDFLPGGFPCSGVVSSEARRQIVLLGSRRRGIKKAPIALAAATVASMFAAGWVTTAQAQEATDPKGAPVVTTQQAKVAGEVAEEVAKREQDPANDSWIEKALANIVEGDVVPFVALADAMLAGVGGEDLAQAFDEDEGSKDEPEDPSPGGSEKEQSDPKAEGSEDDLTQADDSAPERATSNGATKGAEEVPAQVPSGSSPDEDDGRVGGAEEPTAEQGSNPKPESDEASTPAGGMTVNGATGANQALSSGSSSEEGSSNIEQADESSSVAFSPPSSSEDTEPGDGATPSEPGDASARSGETPSAGAGESSGGSYEYDASGSAWGDVSPASEEVPFGFSPTEEGGPPEGSSNEEIGASDESKKAVESYLEGGDERYLEDSLKKDVEDKTTPSESGLPEDESNSFVESDGETDVGRALGEGFGFGSLEEDVGGTPPEQEVAFEEIFSEEAPDAKEELPAGGIEAAGSSGEEQSSRSGVPEALRDFLEAIKQDQSAEERSEGGREDQEQAPANDMPKDAPQGAPPTAGRPDNGDSEGEPGKTPPAGDGPEQAPPTDVPVADQEQPETEEQQSAPAVEQKQEEVPKQDRQQPVEWTTASDRAQAPPSQEQTQPQEQQLPREGGVPQAVPQQVRHQEEPEQHGSGANPKTDGIGSLEQSIPVLGTGQDQGEPSDTGGTLVQQSSALGPSQEGFFTVVNNEQVEQRPLDYVASFAPGRVTVDGIDAGASGPPDPESTEAPTQHHGFHSSYGADTGLDGGGPSWQPAGGDLPSTPVRPASDQAPAPSFEPEVRNSATDGANQAGRRGGDHDLGDHDSVGSADRDSGAPEVHGGGGVPDGGGSGSNGRGADKG